MSAMSDAEEMASALATARAEMEYKKSQVAWLRAALARREHDIEALKAENSDLRESNAKLWHKDREIVELGREVDCLNIEQRHDIAAMGRFKSKIDELKDEVEQLTESREAWIEQYRITVKAGQNMEAEIAELRAEIAARRQELNEYVKLDNAEKDQLRARLDEKCQTCVDNEQNMFEMTKRLDEAQAMRAKAEFLLDHNTRCPCGSKLDERHYWTDADWLASVED